jgi:hypothetical protein
MILKKITAEHVRAAIAEVERAGVPPRRACGLSSWTSRSTSRYSEASRSLVILIRFPWDSTAKDGCSFVARSMLRIPSRPYLTLGVDTRKDKISTTHIVMDHPHAELVCLVDLQTGALHWTGKCYSLAQQQNIVRFPDLSSHFVQLDSDPVMILGCHDLSVYNPQTQAVVRGWKQDVGSAFRALAVGHNPVAVLHHPHSTTTVWTWKGKWQRLEQELPLVKQYLGAGAYSYRDPGWDRRDDLASVLGANRCGNVLSVVVRLCVAP